MELENQTQDTKNNESTEEFVEEPKIEKVSIQEIEIEKTNESNEEIDKQIDDLIKAYSALTPEEKEILKSDLFNN